MRNKRASSAFGGETGHRLGALLVAVLICLSIAGMLLGSLVYAALALRQTVQVHLWREQATWLVQSGIERAAAKLAADPGYRCESWRIEAGRMESRYATRVEIAVEPAAEQPNRCGVHVAAYYPDRAKQRVFRSVQVVVVVPSSQNAGDRKAEGNKQQEG